MRCCWSRSSPGPWGRGNTVTIPAPRAEPRTPGFATFCSRDCSNPQEIRRQNRSDGRTVLSRPSLHKGHREQGAPRVLLVTLRRFGFFSVAAKPHPCHRTDGKWQPSHPVPGGPCPQRWARLQCRRHRFWGRRHRFCWLRRGSAKLLANALITAGVLCSQARVALRLWVVAWMSPA